MKGNKAFVNSMIVLFLFMPLILYLIIYQSEKPDYPTRIAFMRLAYYYDDARYDLERIIGTDDIYFRMINSTEFTLSIKDRYRVRDYTSELTSYDADLASYFNKIGIGYRLSFASLENYDDYGDIFFATKSGSLNSYYRRYINSTQNASIIKIYYDDVGKPENYYFDFYITDHLPFVGDEFTASGNTSSGGTPIYIRMCYPYLGQTQCRQYETNLNPGGTASYIASFHLDVCSGVLNITVAISGVGNDHDEVYIYIPEDIHTNVNITLNGTTLDSDYDFTQLFCGNRGNDDSYLILWYGDNNKGDPVKIILDEG